MSALRSSAIIVDGTYGQPHILLPSPTNRGSPTSKAQNGQQRPQKGPLWLLEKIMPAGGMLSASVNMASTAVGAGILGLPNAFNSTGYIVALIYIIVIAAETVYSTWLLVHASEMTGLRTYEVMADGLFFKRAGIVVAIIRFFNGFGACVAYVITVGNLLTPLLVDDSEPDPTFWHDRDRGVRVLQAALWLTCMLPLVIPRNINSLRHISAVAMVFVFYFVIIIMQHAAYANEEGPGVAPAVTGNRAIEGIGTFIFAYLTQVNSNDIYFEMQEREPFRFTLCSCMSMTFCGLFYYMAGLFGYLHFGNTLSGSILLQYSPLDEPEVLVAYIGIFIKICASYGIIANAFRNSLYYVLDWNPYTVTAWKHCSAVVALSAAVLIAGLFISDIRIVFNLVGGICGSAIGFILPALFRMYAGGWSLKEVGIVNWVATYLTLFGGVVGVVFGTAAAIYELV